MTPGQTTPIKITPQIIRGLIEFCQAEESRAAWKSESACASQKFSKNDLNLPFPKHENPN
jgi:hypothetical protein